MNELDDLKCCGNCKYIEQDKYGPSKICTNPIYDNSGEIIDFTDICQSWEKYSWMRESIEEAYFINGLERKLRKIK